MRLTYAVLVSLLAVGLVSSASIDRWAQDRPRVDVVEPSEAIPGAVVITYGEHLGRSHVLDVYLASPDSFALVHIVEQRDEWIRFEVPKSPISSRYSIVLALAGRREPELVDQQVFITIVTD